MLAKRIPSILPEVTFEEALEITKNYSIIGQTSEEKPVITTRPFRNPHHTITQTALIGGGKYPQPGEVSLAHYGVLFLDELPEFEKNTLEVLREPLEERKITISRINATVTYPCNFMFVASMNPCLCGYYGDARKKCHCKKEQIKRYMNRISGPLLDRIDIQIEVKALKYKEITQENKIENSEVIRKRVNQAREIQKQRYKEYKIFSNSELTEKMLEEFCKIDKESKLVLEKAFERLNLSVRAYDKILKVARTIADLENEKEIQTKHITEAIQYRSLDRKYWENI